MLNTKLHSSVPYFLIMALMGLVPVLNNKYPVSFFPAFSPGVIEILSVVAGIAAAVMGFKRAWAVLQQKSLSDTLIREAVENRHSPATDNPGETASAGRIVSRLVRNADEDLREITPDFTMDSLKRLENYLPDLLEEMKSKEDSLIRLGVVGTYLGETLCRNLGWQWFFKADIALRQFSYLVSVLRKGEKEMDPYAWAADLFRGKRKISDLVKEIQ